MSETENEHRYPSDEDWAKLAHHTFLIFSPTCLRFLEHQMNPVGMGWIER
jgi:hypothetical protein